MSIIEALLLGIVQGLTEFIPVSSSGHLIIVHDIFGSSENTLAFDVALHVGTLIALLVFFRNELWSLAKNAFKNNQEGKLARLIVLATLPAATIGFLLGDFIDDKVRSTLVVACTLGIVGILMLLADKYATNTEDKDKYPTTKQGMIVGFAQVFALIPGVSRSGATITAGIFAGLGRELATKFSFFLAVPIVAGSAFGILLKDSSLITFDGSLMVGVVAAFISGLFAIKFMLGVIKKVGLKPFAYYRIAISVMIILYIVIS